MRKALLLLVITLLTGLTPAAAAATQPGDEGRAALYRGEHEKAAALLEKAIALEPKNPEYHFLLGAAYADMARRAGKLKQVSLAKKTKDAFERAVALDPRYTEARFGLITYYLVAPGFLGGGEDKAIAQATTIKSYDSIDGHRAFGRIYTHQKKPDLARKEFVDAVRENPRSAKAHYHLGNFYLNEKNWAAALHELDMTLQLDAAYMPAWLRVGQVAARSEKDYPRGEEALRKYLAYSPGKGEPSHASAWYALGLIQEKQGKKAEAKASFLNALKIAPNDKTVTAALKRVS